MALKAGRVGVAPTEVDNFGKIIGGGSPGSDYYTKTQTDNKFETKTHVNNTFQKINLAVPISMLSGTMLTVEDALQGLQSDKQDVGGSLNLEISSLRDVSPKFVYAKVFKYGKVAGFFAKSNASVPTNTKIGIIPEGYRPHSEIYNICYVGGGTDTNNNTTRYSAVNNTADHGLYTLGASPTSGYHSIYGIWFTS